MSATEATTFILRFRDLVTPSGGTISLHRQLIHPGGPVWWGWWNKAGETVPDDVFRSLLTEIKRTGGLDVFLMDSGNAQLFTATCTDLRWDAAHNRIPSPEPASTPAYYKDQRYLAWCQLSRISEPTADSVLTDYSYVRVDDFFEDKPSRYGVFYGKRIHSLKELIQQNRTIWFIRPARATDPVHEVSFYDSSVLEPSDFDHAYRQTPSANLLWVSDLHYSLSGHHGFEIEPTSSRASVGSAIEHGLEDQGIRDLGGVIVSGDITWKADPAEYRQAQYFFEWTRRWTKLGNASFVVGPGNHDLRFSDDASAKTAEVNVAPDVARAAYAAFYRDLFLKAPNAYLSSGRKFLLANAVPVDIACLNSSLLEQRQGLFQGHGFLGDDQLRDAAEKLGWVAGAPGPHAFRIVVVHHHVMPVTYREQPVSGQIYSVALDAEALVQWSVGHRVALILHGHMHQPFCAKVSRPVDPSAPAGSWHSFHVVGLGASGVGRNDLGAVGKNIAAVLRFEDDGVEVRLFSISPDNPSAAHWSVRVPYRQS
jgi:3',5'-cyclic AMP phosphodiesterase CpdA